MCNTIDLISVLFCSSDSTHYFTEHQPWLLLDKCQSPGTFWRLCLLLQMFMFVTLKMYIARCRWALLLFSQSRYLYIKDAYTTPLCRCLFKHFARLTTLRRASWVTEFTLKSAVVKFDHHVRGSPVLRKICEQYVSLSCPSTPQRWEKSIL